MHKVVRVAGVTSRTTLIAVSAAQLTANLAGQVVALRRRRAFDVPFMHGSPDHVGRDSWWFGTAYSAPSYMLAAQIWAITRLPPLPTTAPEACSGCSRRA